MPKSKISLLLLILLGVALLFSPMKFISYFLAVLVGSLILNTLIRKNIGLLTSFMITFLLVTCMLQLIGIGFWLFDISLNTVGFLALVFVLELVYVWRIQKINSVMSTNRFELTSFGIAITSTLILVFGLLRGGDFTEQILRFIVRGFDSSTHLSLIMTVYKNQGYVYGPLEKVHHDVIFSSLTAYPQGWHLVTSSMWHSVSDALSFSNTPLLLTYFFITAMFWYFLLIFCASRFTAEIIRYFSHKESVGLPILLTGLLGVSFVLQVTIALAFARYGFVNYIPLVIYVLCIFLLALFMYSKKLSRTLFLLLGALLATGTIFTWMLAAPIAFGLVALSLIATLDKSDLLIFTNFNRKLLLLGTLMVIFAAGSLIQLYLQYKYAVVPNNISASTVIWTTNNLLLLIIIFSTLGFAIFSALNKRMVYSKGFLYSALAVLVVPAALYLYLFAFEGRTGYYFEKLNSIVTVVFLCTAGGIGITYLKRFAAKQGVLPSLLLVFVLALSIPMIFNIDSKELRFMLGKDWSTSTVTAKQINKLINKGAVKNNNVFIVKEYNYEEDVISTHFINVISQVESKCSSSIGWNQIIRSYDVMADEIKRCAEEDQRTIYTVIASNANQQFWQQKLSSVKNIDILVQD